MKEWLHLMKHGTLEAIDARLRAEPHLALVQDPAWGCPLVSAVIRDDPALVELLLALGADPNTFPEGHFSAFSHVRSIAVAELLVLHGADMARARQPAASASVQSSGGTMALSGALRRDDVALTAWLLERGVKPSSDALFDAGYLARELALRAATPDVLTKLLERAADMGELALVEEALAAGADPSLGQALHRAAEGDHDDILRSLLRSGAPVDKLDESGSTPLLAAAFEGAARAVRVLLEAGADPSVANAFGQRAIDGALALGDQATVRPPRPVEG